MLTFLVFWGGGTLAFGQRKESTPRPQQAAVSYVKLAKPTELSDAENVYKRTLFSLLGSPDTIAMLDETPAAGPTPQALSAPVVETLEPEASSVSLTQEKGISSQLEQGPGSSKIGQEYWKPVSNKAEAVEYEELDAETSRDVFNAESVQKLRKPMRDIRIVAEDNAIVPKDLAARFMVKEPVLKIVAAGIRPPQPDRYPIVLKHRPLYYEQPHLEQCGRGCGIAQNAISAGQFCLRTFFLPYHLCKTKPGRPINANGDCLSCQPYSLNCNVLPLSYKGMATEAAVFAGFTFLLL